jgi:hypothetical protein
MRDPFTNEEFNPKRNNQKFANSKNRIKFHNTRANQLRVEKAFIDRPLNNNLKILNDIMADKEDETFHKEFLRGKGFNFEIFNSTCKTEGTTGYCIYNFIIIYNSSNVKIIRSN